MKLGNAT
jgi:hypothetical protein